MMVDVALIAASVGSIITACLGVAAYLYSRGRSEGIFRTEIKTLNDSIDDLKNEVTNTITTAVKRIDEAHGRIDIVSRDHHALREQVAREYVTYERMREIKIELTSSIDKMARSYTDGLAIVHTRLDQLIHTIAGIKPSYPTPPQHDTDQ